SSAPSSSSGSDPAAVARAQKLVLVQADFPPGWTGAPPTPDTPEAKTAKQELATCIDASAPDAKVADVNGQSFSMGSPRTQVTSEATIAKDGAAYQQDV